eukprot:m.135526 g.135526  ORF g.135526 m.135526 type:complete len:86 (+) comp13975_c0_seq11:2990-3247(+)
MLRCIDNLPLLILPDYIFGTASSKNILVNHVNFVSHLTSSVFDEHQKDKQPNTTFYKSRRLKVSLRRVKKAPFFDCYDLLLDCQC